jgi:hypothetical protein
VDSKIRKGFIFCYLGAPCKVWTLIFFEAEDMPGKTAGKTA